MKVLKAISIFLLISLSGVAQTLDTSKVFDALSKASYASTQVQADPDVARTIQAIDENLPGLITSLFHFKPLRYTVIQAPNMTVKTLISKELTLKMILKDSTPFHFRDLWIELKHDTTKFFADELVIREYKLRYPGSQYAKLAYTVDPLAIRSSVQLKNMLFYFGSINNTIESINKELNRKDSKALYKCLSTSFDVYDDYAQKIKAKPIKVTDIVLGNPDLIFAGIDIYGTHYLLTFNKAQNWKLVNTARQEEH